MAYTWQQFIDAVIERLSDGKPSEAMFTEAVACYVNARIAQDLRGDKDGYAIHQNRYSSLRRKLSGFATLRTDNTLRTDVRALLTDVAPSNELFALACSYWLQAHGVGAINRNPEEAGSWMAMYRQRRVQLLGFSPSFADTAALRAAVNPLMTTSALSDNLSAYMDAQLEAAKSDLVGLGGWVNQQIAAAKADLQSLGDRVAKEIRAAVIGMQELITVYRLGQVSTIEYADLTADGFAMRGTLPEQAAIREAWIIDKAQPECGRVRCSQISWECRHDFLICAEPSEPTIAIDPYGKMFIVGPAIREDVTALELHWDGVRITFNGSDTVPLDEGAVEAVALRVQAQLALEFGDGQAVAREYNRLADQRMGLLYTETLRRKRA